MTQLEGIAAVRRWLRGTNQDAVLWRATWMFVALDAFFTGLVGAYAYAHANVAGVLVFIGVQQLCTTTGHALSNPLMRQAWSSPLKAQRLGVSALALTLVAAGALPAPAWLLLLILAGMGGLARGVTYGTRLWMEAQLGGPGVRQRYLSMVEASSTLCKVVVPVWALLLLSVTDRFESIFLSGGLLFLALLAVTRAQRSTFRVPQPYQLVALWRQKAYWGNAPYFLVEGAGHALRTALFVSGAMTVVGSLKSYARLEMCASLLAAAWLLAQGRLALPGPSLHMLRKFLCLLALAWGCLLAALWSSWWLPGFVVLYAVSLPLVSAQKAGVTLNGMVQAQGALETHLMARSLLLMVARVCTLAVFGVVHWWGAPARDVLVGMVGAALLLLPLEYWTARRMQPATKAPAQGQGQGQGH